MFKRIAGLGLVVLIATSASAQSKSEAQRRKQIRLGDLAKVSESMWTDGAWPVTVDHGRLKCDESPQGRPAVWFEAPDGKIYPLNGVANSIAKMREKPYQKKLHPIWREDEGIGDGIRVSIFGFIERGLKLCDD